MTKQRFWVIGGDYEGADFTSLIPGTETLAGPFNDAERAHFEWRRLAGAPCAGGCTTRYSIASEEVRTAA